MRTQGGMTAMVGIAAMLVAAAWVGDANAAKPPRLSAPKAQESFTDRLDAYDTARWTKADGWKNGSPFANAWKADHVTFGGGQMELRLDNVVTLGMPYTSGEYRTAGYYGYGCYQAKFTPVRRPGVITSFFTYAGPHDNGGNGKHNEIDVEFVGDFAVAVDGQPYFWVQFNFWTNDDAYASRNEYVHVLGFDPTQQAAVYAFYWHPGGIVWYVDGEPVYEVEDSQAVPTPKATDSLQKIMMNLWPVDATAEGWAGKFVYPGEPLRARYDWVRYTKGQSCEGLEDPESPTPPPSGEATDMSVGDIALALDPRGTQVIARVAVVDGLGQPVAGAAVGGAWYGVITGGDTLRTTDANGIATFYSARSRTSGEVSFCVTGVSRNGMTYTPHNDRETCDSIVK